MQIEKKAWGDVLTDWPLTDRPGMFIIAEIDKPKGGKSSDMRFWFEGAPAEKPLKLHEFKVWQGRLFQFMKAVQETVATMANPVNHPKPVKKKKPKKK